MFSNRQILAKTTMKKKLACLGWNGKGKGEVFFGKGVKSDEKAKRKDKTDKAMTFRVCYWINEVYH